MKSPPPPPPPLPPLPLEEDPEPALEAALPEREDEELDLDELGLLKRLRAFRSDAVPVPEPNRDPAPVALLAVELELFEEDDDEPPDALPEELLEPEPPLLLPPPPPPPPLRGPPRLPCSCGARSEPKRSGAVTPVRRIVRSRLPAWTRAVRIVGVAATAPVCDGVSGLACQ